MRKWLRRWRGEHAHMVSVSLPGVDGTKEPPESIPVPTFREMVKELRTLEGQAVTVHVLDYSEDHLELSFSMLAGRLTFGDEDVYPGRFVGKLLMRTRLSLARTSFVSFMLVAGDGPLPIANVHFSSGRFRGAEWNLDRDTLTIHLGGNHDMLVQRSPWGEWMGGDYPPEGFPTED